MNGEEIEDMAETKTETKKAETKKVFIRKPAGVKNEKSKIVGLNGKMYTVPYGVEVEVPLGVAEILEMSERYAEKEEAEREKILANQ